MELYFARYESVLPNLHVTSRQGFVVNIVDATSIASTRTEMVVLGVNRTVYRYSGA